MRTWLITILGVITLFSCATKTKVEYVDREVIKYVAKVQHDTVTNNTHDSIYHIIFQKGDTVYNTKYKEITRYRDRVTFIRDTIYQDSIQTQIKETSITKKIIPKWCYLSLSFYVLLFVFGLIKITKWQKTL